MGSCLCSADALTCQGTWKQQDTHEVRAASLAQSSTGRYGKWKHLCASAAADIQLWKLHVQPGGLWPQ